MPSSIIVIRRILSWRQPVLVSILLLAWSGWAQEQAAPWAPSADAWPSPALREQVSLNGIWDFRPNDVGAWTSIPVPEYWDAAPGFSHDEVHSARYRRTVSVPAAWEGKRILLCFEGVAHLAEIRIGGTLLHRHVGAFIPFVVDITDHASAGKPVTVEVLVRGGASPPIVDAAGQPLYPVGYHGHQQAWGIPFPVWLRAYGQQHIRDAQIVTSWRERTLAVTYRVQSRLEGRRWFRLEGSVRPKGAAPDAAPVLSFTRSFSANGAGGRQVPVTTPWSDPLGWTPETPQLYELDTRLYLDDELVDEERRQFGFREIWIDGTGYKLNGIPLHLRGDSTIIHHQQYDRKRYRHMAPDAWRETVAAIKARHLNVLRFHQAPPPDWMLDICDEMGLMVIAESAIYAREYSAGADLDVYLDNARAWLGAWVRGSRNHPAVVCWSAENEMGKGWLRWMSDADLRLLGAAIRGHDRTRPIIYEGDEDVGAVTVNLHYPEGYRQQPVADPLPLLKAAMVPGKVMGCGECITSYGEHAEANRWWQGTAVRAYRRADYADVRPFLMDWCWQRDVSDPQTANVMRSFHPVACFDVGYDRLGIAPLVGGEEADLPLLVPGPNKRRLTCYNDRFSDTTVPITARLLHGDAVLAEATVDVEVPLGGALDLDAVLAVPTGLEDLLILELATAKRTGPAFSERYRFRVAPAPADGADIPAEAEIVLTPRLTALPSP